MTKKKRSSSQRRPLTDTEIKRLVNKIKTSVKEYWSNHLLEFDTDYGYIGRHIAKVLRLSLCTPQVSYRSHVWRDTRGVRVRTFTFHVVIRGTGDCYKDEFRKRGHIHAEHYTFVFDTLGSGSLYVGNEHIN